MFGFTINKSQFCEKTAKRFEKSQIHILAKHVQLSTGTKLPPSSSLRCRSRSCCQASFSDESFNTERGHGISIDSGIGGTPIWETTLPSGTIVPETSQIHSQFKF